MIMDILDSDILMQDSPLTDPQLHTLGRAMRGVMYRIAAWAGDVAKALGDPQNPPPHQNRRGRPPPSNGLMIGIAARELNRLMCRRVAVVTPTNINRNSIMNGVLRNGYRCVLERCRLYTYSKYGLQYLHLVGLLLDDITVDGVYDTDECNALRGLIIEITMTGFTRCIEGPACVPTHEILESSNVLNFTDDQQCREKVMAAMHE
eukprot:GHVO01052276.1.p1 GENE.GHVO01052276.1~~GHVO01052276.1.p1  ORF type:complete len:205 (-),score=44.18 GHVO01052276.1:188-802(-)